MHEGMVLHNILNDGFFKAMYDLKASKIIYAFCFLNKMKVKKPNSCNVFLKVEWNH